MVSTGFDSGIVGSILPPSHYTSGRSRSGGLPARVGGDDGVRADADLYRKRQPEAGRAVVRHMNISLGRASSADSDGEVMVELLENARPRRVHPQSTSTDQRQPDGNSGDGRRVEARLRRTNTAIPYFGYARQDRRPWSARVRSRPRSSPTLTTVGVNRVAMMDLTPTRSRDFSISGRQHLRHAGAARRSVETELRQPAGRSPDVGGVVRARAIAKRLDSDLAIIDAGRRKRFRGDEHIGDVAGRACGRHRRHRQHLARRHRRLRRTA